MWKIRKKYVFEAAHYLPNVPDGHQCGRVHGHSYTLEVELSSSSLSDHGWVMDFSDVSSVVKPLVATLDHQLLNEVDEALGNPTSEILAEWAFARLAPALPGLVAVSIAETASSLATYSVPAGSPA